MKVEKSIAVLLVASTIVFASFVEAQQQPAQQEAAVAIRSEVQRLWQQAHQLRDQGKLKEAIETTQKMLAKERTLFNRPSADIAVSLEFLAELQVAAEDNAAAEKSLNERLTICAQVFGERDSRTTDTRIELEDVQRIQKMSAEQRRRLAHAERLHAEAREAYAAKNALKTLELETQVLEIRRQLLGENHPDVAVTCSNMALVYLEAKVWDSAERYYRDALRIRRQRLGTTHPVYFESLDELADMLRNHADQLVENEQFTDATAALAEALAIRADRHGVDDWRPRELRVELTHAVRLASLTPEQRKQFERAREVNHEGVNLYNEEKYEQAVEKFEEAVAIRRKLLGVEYSETLTFLQNCAIVAAELGQNGKAEKLFREVTNVRYSLFGTGHAGTRDSIERLANHLEYLGGQQLQRGEFDPAIAKRREVVQLRTILLGQSDYRVGDARRALKHAQTLAGLTEDQREQVKTADQLRETSLSLNAEGKYREALVPCQQALEIRETILGQQHPDTAASLRNLATLYYLLDEYAKAEPLLRENLEIRKQLLGQQHPDTADSISDLARLYAAQGEYSEAESLYQQSLEIRKQALGEEHPDYLTNLDSLATLYASMDKYDEAEQLFRQVLEVRKRVEGEENLDYAQSLSSLAWLYQLMGEFANAEPLYLQLLDIEKKILGDDHPAYAAALDQLTDCYVSMGEFAKAEPLYRQALDIVRKAHGEQHPDYAEGLKKLASYHLLVGEVAKTRSVYRQALDIMKKVHGEQHPDYIETLSRLASTYTMIGDYKEAESSYLRVLELRKKASGEEHADYAESLDALSGFYLLVGDYANAKALARRSLEINKKLLGEEHPLYVKLLSDSTPFYLRFGDYARAEEMLVEALNITKKVVGQQDAAYGTILGNLAGVYVAMGDYEKAEPLFRQALDIISGGGGEEYAFADTAQNLARLYQSMGDYANAETYFRKVLEIKASLLGPQHREYVADLSDVAMVLMHAGDYKNAERLLREALDVAQETLGKQDPS